MEVISQSVSAKLISDFKFCLKTTVTDKVTHNFTCSPEHFCGKKSSRSKSDRFLINLYEKPSFNNLQKLERRVFNDLILSKTKQFETNKLWTICDKHDNGYIFRKNNDYLHRRKLAMNSFVDLRLQRDIECIKIKEASNVLGYLNTVSRDGHWFERLTAEKMLLESGVAVKLLRSKISEDYVYENSRDVIVGTISVSHFRFCLNTIQNKVKGTEFFVLLLSSGTKVESSKIARATNGEIVFDEKFTFSITRNFSVKVQIYSLVMKETSKLMGFNKFLPNKDFANHTYSKLQFKNLNTCDFEEVRIQKTSFQLSGETEVTASSFHNKFWELNLKSNSTLNECCNFSVNTENFKIQNRRSGFLTLGRDCNDIIVWNRCWCVLDGNVLKVYKYPSEEEVVIPQITLDLLNCALNKIEEAPRTSCNRARSMLIEITEVNAVKIFFFMADNNEDLKNWLTDFNLVLDLLRFKIAFEL